MSYSNAFIQKQLNKLNAGLTVDGVIGDMSLFWLKGLQYAGGLKTDGIYGPKTHKFFELIDDTKHKDTAHFHQYEFNCQHCGANPGIDINLLILLESIRYKFKRAIAITSGYRCPIHNARVNGEVNSYHLKAKAADIVVSGIHSQSVYDVANMRNKKGGAGRYIVKGFTHVDCRGYKSRWVG
jgi:hypothetical protein